MDSNSTSTCTAKSILVADVGHRRFGHRRFGCQSHPFLNISVESKEKSVQIQIDQVVERQSSIGLQELEASLASFSTNSKDLAKKGFQID